MPDGEDGVVTSDITEFLDDLKLVDHHVHGVIRSDLGREEFESVITESDRRRATGTTNFDSQVGLAIRRFCAPILDIAPSSSPSDYVTQRLQLGAEEVNARLLRAAHLGALLIDTGFATTTLLDLDGMANVAQAPTWEILRLEAVAESIMSSHGSQGFANIVREYLGRAVDAGIKGTKSIAAYRYGLHFPALRPSDADVDRAAKQWHKEINDGAQLRLHDAVIISFLAWSAVDLQLPLQFHVGYGDSDIRLLTANPAHLTDFMIATQSSGASIMLLHCYPYHRESAYLAQMFPHVYFDVGEAINYSGLSAVTIVRESLEIAPFGKQLYSSDGWGPAELHYLGARLWRNAMSHVLSEWIQNQDCTVHDAQHIASLIGRENATRVYRLDL